MPAVEDLNDIVGLLIWVTAPIVSTVWVAKVSARTRELQSRVTDLEAAVERERADNDQLRHLFRLAIRHIREWLEWSRQHVAGQPAPALPDELKDEV
jgi:hypothetical protein